MRLRFASFCFGLALGVLGATSAEAGCLRVDRVLVSGVQALDMSEVAAAQGLIEGQCLPFATALDQIDAVLQAITLSYVDRGYIAARAWLPEQDLSDGQLEIRVVEGVLDRVRFDGAENARWEARSFPGQRGAPVQLRDVEQGLDVIRSMPGFDAQMELTPGADAGASDLEIATSGRPWQFRISTTNLGSDKADEGAAAATGQYITSVDASVSHVLGFNETLRLNLSRSQPDHPINLFHKGPRTWGGNASLEVPTGRLTLRGTIGWSGYRTVIPGAFSAIDVDGWTRSVGVGGTYLLHRDQGSKTKVSFDLTRRENENRIADVRIDASSRVLTSARLELEHERRLGEGQVELRAGVEKGLRLFGAENARAQPDGQPDAQYLLLDAQLRYRRGFETEHGRIGFDTSLRGQWSSDRLYGTQQFNLGGSSSVRGSKEVVLSGNRGVVLRNEVSYRPAARLPQTLGVFEAYMTGDIGYIGRQQGYGVTGGTVAGATMGLRLIGGQLELDASYGRILRAPSGVVRPDGVFLMTAAWRF